jgi:sigma-B regulation protein RsbU (phosphoserine phosphatase)
MEQTMRILVVDDEPDLEALMRQKFRRQIRERAIELHFARDGEEALRRVEEVPGIEVVLTDINMPGMDGLALLARLRDAHPHIGGVIVSAYGDMGNIRTAMNRGAFDFLMKPIDFSDLEKTMQRSIQYVRQQREAASIHRQLVAIRQELEVAGVIQRSILPLSFPVRAEFSLHARMEAAREIGGDFYDSFPLPDGRIAFLVGDVSGKGVPAALYMAVCRTLVLAVAQTSDSLAATIAATNTMLCSYDMQCMFVTLLVGVIEPATGFVELCSCGHEPPLLLPDGSPPRPLPLPRNLALGIEADVGPFQTQAIQLAPGDMLLLYTDGLTEAHGPGGELLGSQRLRELLEAPRHSCQALVAAVFDAAEAHAAGIPQSDDLTVLALRYAGARQPRTLFEATVEHDLQRLADMLAELEAFCGNLGVSRDEFFPVLLSAEECLANVIAHGQRAEGAPRLPIHFQARHADGVITLVIEDNSEPFDPLSHPAPDLEATPESRPAGGLGIFLARRHMDSMTYERREGATNVLTLTRRLDRPNTTKEE